MLQKQASETDIQEIGQLIWAALKNADLQDAHVPIELPNSDLIKILWCKGTEGLATLTEDKLWTHLGLDKKQLPFFNEFTDPDAIIEPWTEDGKKWLASKSSNCEPLHPAGISWSGFTACCSTPLKQNWYSWWTVSGSARHSRSLDSSCVYLTFIGTTMPTRSSPGHSVSGFTLSCSYTFITHSLIPFQQTNDGTIRRAISQVLHLLSSVQSTYTTNGHAKLSDFSNATHSTYSLMSGSIWHIANGGRMFTWRVFMSRTIRSYWPWTA